MSRPLLLTPRFILGPRKRHVLTWLLAAALTGALGWRAWHAQDGVYFEGHADRTRADGNLGHALVDFGGQWLMARMIADGHARELYHRDVQRSVLVAAYPRSDEGEGQTTSDADRLMGWLVELPIRAPSGSPIGGALYPPTQALMFAPLAVLEPRPAYRVMQYSSLGLAWLASLAMSRVSGGRLWWPVATSVILVFPGFMGALYLGQNSILSLAILACGWWLVARGHDAWAGAVWGLLAYKPTWAAAFFLVPLLTRRWRMAAVMAGVGLLLVLATLPLVGRESWRYWVAIGREASFGYDTDPNWIFKGRDLLGIPRRWLLDFSEQDPHKRTSAAATVIGWSFLIFVVGSAAAVAWRRKDHVHALVGDGPAFVALGAWLSCFHFIFYDSLLAAFGVVLLLCDPRQYLRTVRLTAADLAIDAAQTATGRPESICLLNSFVLTVVGLLVLIEQAFPLLSLDISVTLGFLPAGGRFPNPLEFSTKTHGTPWDTFCLLILWGYCGVRVLMAPRHSARPAAP